MKTTTGGMGRRVKSPKKRYKYLMCNTDRCFIMNLSNVKAVSHDVIVRLCYN